MTENVAGDTSIYLITKNNLSCPERIYSVTMQSKMSYYEFKLSSIQIKPNINYIFT